MFGSGFEEEKKDSILIHDIECSTLQQLLEFMYTGQLKIDDATIQELKLLAAADKYEVLQLTKALDSYLCTNVKDGIVFESWKAANLHNAPLLKEASARYISSTMDREATAKILKVCPFFAIIL
ncbi:hypothetical protein CLOM_g1678 [Closterium sp. NIES-68]|nr:hypothetical protein CLOM_g1678 [Closterium sp. NIES-68]GJP79869.1 hypothetical protein CLOP_g10086 [Closterium sp. NIES-67]